MSDERMSQFPALGTRRINFVQVCWKTFWADILSDLKEQNQTIFYSIWAIYEQAKKWKFYHLWKYIQLQSSQKSHVCISADYADKDF